MSRPRLGVTVPLAGLPLSEHRPVLRRLWGAGYREVSTGEVNANDAITPLVLFSAWQSDLTVSCAVVSAFTRGPGLLAMTAATLGEAAPGRSRFGIGAGSDRVVEDWNGVPFTKPYSRVANALRFLRSTLATGQPDPDAAEYLGSSGFRLAEVPLNPPKLFLAALGPRMQRLAKAEADGVILNFLGADDLAVVRDQTEGVERQVDSPLEVEVRIFVIPGSDTATEMTARRQIAAYLTVPVYTNFQRWLGRGPQLDPLLSAWEAGDRKGAVAAVPDRLIEDLFVTGTPYECAQGVKRYLDAGVDSATLALFPPHGVELDPLEQAEFLCELGDHIGSRAVSA